MGRRDARDGGREGIQRSARGAERTSTIRATPPRTSGTSRGTWSRTRSRWRPGGSDRARARGAASRSTTNFWPASPGRAGRSSEPGREGGRGADASVSLRDELEHLRVELRRILQVREVPRVRDAGTLGVSGSVVAAISPISEANRALHPVYDERPTTDLPAPALNGGSLVLSSAIVDRVVQHHLLR